MVYRNNWKLYFLNKKKMEEQVQTKEICIFKDGSLVFTIDSNSANKVQGYIDDADYDVVYSTGMLDVNHIYTLENNIIVKGEAFPVPPPPED